MEWIMINHKLPKDKQTVVIYAEILGRPVIKRAIYLDKYITEKVDKRNLFVSDDKGFYDIQFVTHWMPDELPLPPTK